MKKVDKLVAAKNREIVSRRRVNKSENVSQTINDYIAFEKKALAIVSPTSDSEQVPDIQSALMSFLKLDDPHLLLEWDWAAAQPDEVVKAIQPYLILPPKAVATVDVGETIIPAGTLQKLEEVRLKDGGEIWVIHKNDVDPFPSDPHAHNAESGLKLDLGSGELYLRRKCVDSVTRKNLIRIRNLAEQKNVQLPNLSI